MKRIVMAVAGLALLAAAAVTKGTESKWEVKKGTTKVATVTLLSNGTNSRAEWKVDAESPTDRPHRGAGNLVDPPARRRRRVEGLQGRRRDLDRAGR